MLEMMKDSILGCLWGGFSAHSRSCDNGFTASDRDRSPHERQRERDSSPGTVTCSWGQGRKGQGRRDQRQEQQQRDQMIYRKIEKPRDVSPPKRRPPPAKRPRYILDLKTDTCYLETDIDRLQGNKSRSFESTDSGIQSSWNTTRSRSRIIETEADVHREGSDTVVSPAGVAMAIGPNGEHLHYQPIRGILKKSTSYQPQAEVSHVTVQWRIQGRERMSRVSRKYPSFIEETQYFMPPDRMICLSVSVCFFVCCQL